jgi:hypothetical protein
MSEHLPVTITLGILGKQDMSGIDENEDDLNWKYSSIATEQLVLTPPAFNTGKNYTVTIYDISGRQLIQQAISNPYPTAISTYSLSGGMYLIHIANNNGTVFTGKFIKPF